MDRLAVIADAHGNSWALSAVLEDIARRGLSHIVNLGDTADADMDPSGTVALMMASGADSIAGNYETFRPGQLSPEQEAWLTGLPKTLDLGEIFCCHGTPVSDTDALIEEITLDRVELAPVQTIAARLAGIAHPVILCAHKHMPRMVMLPSGQVLVNPGSVGLPAYWNDEPVLHTVEAGSPHARYAILTRTGAGWAVEHVALPYPWDHAVAAARASGREDRAAFLATGRALVPPELLAAAKR
ncbi:MAG: metallophosphoesterase family protein [Pseudomonadota bacterium]